MQILKNLFAALFVIFSSFSLAQPGTLDTTFNPNSRERGFGGGANNIVNDIDTLPNGEIIVSGAFTEYSDIRIPYIAKLNADGTLDKEFNKLYGMASDWVHNTIVCNDGKILIVGKFTQYRNQDAYYVAKVNIDGSLDTTFKSGLTGQKEIWSSEVQKDGKIIIGGEDSQTYTPYFGRLNQDGSIDTSFIPFIPVDAIFNIKIQKDDKILVRQGSTIVRLNPNGSIDNTFHSIEMISYIPSDFLLLQNGEIMVGNPSSVAKYDTSGNIISSFKVGVTDNNVDNVRSNDGKNFYICGLFKKYNGISCNGLVRVNEFGELDTTFKLDTNTKNVSRILVVQEHLNKIYIGGDRFTYNNLNIQGLSRLNIDGSTDTTFIFVGFNKASAISDIAEHNDGKVLVSTTYGFYNQLTIPSCIRLLKNGNLDHTFNVQVIGVSCVKVLPDNKILIGGAFTSVNSSANQKYIAKLNPDGTTDSTFENKISMSGAFASVYGLEVQTDGKIIVKGNFDGKIARLNTNGSIDNNYLIGSAASGVVRSIKLQKDGKLLVGGDFTKFNQDNVSYLLRLNQDGTIDSTFKYNNLLNLPIGAIQIDKQNRILISSTKNDVVRLMPSGLTDSTFSVTIDSNVTQIHVNDDGRIYLAGSFSTVNNIHKRKLVCIDSQGLIDTSFQSKEGFMLHYSGLSVVNSLLVLKDGNLMTTGEFTSYNGKSCNRIARINGYPNSSACNNLTLTFKEVDDVHCQVSGKAKLKAYQGHSPYNYTWFNSNVGDSTKTFTVKGIYGARVTDSKGCVDTSYLLINEPKEMNNFDLNSALIASSFRKGFSAKIFLTGINEGCVLQDGKIKLILSKWLNYQTAFPAPNNIIGDTLIWNFSQLQFEGKAFNAVIDVHTSNLAKIGDSVIIRTLIDPNIGDTDPTNNFHQYIFTVINGYDPNYISVDPSGLCEEGYIKPDQKLTYAVHFQNTGNAEAINISVLDSIDANLDLNSLHVLSSSDTMYTQVLAGNVIKFAFDNIMLIDSTHNEPMSHGYVVYEILPKQNLNTGNQIRNKAEIYFDFNPAIITNSVFNTIYTNQNQLPCSPSSINDNISPRISIFPNPSNGVFTLISEREIPNFILVYDKTGKLLMEKKNISYNTEIDLNTFANDMYFVKVNYDNNFVVSKVIVNR